MTGDFFRCALPHHLGRTLVVSDDQGNSQGHLWYDPHGSVLTGTLPMTLTEQLLSTGYSAELSVALGRLWESGLPSTVKAATMQLAQASQHGLGIVSRPASSWTSHAMMDRVVGRAFGRKLPLRDEHSSTPALC